MAGKFSRFILFISLVICVGIVLIAYLIMTLTASPASWDKAIGVSGGGMGYSVQQTSDGGYIITGGTTSSHNGLTNLLLAKTDSRGNLLWSRSYDDDRYALGRSVQQTSDGGYIVAGSSTIVGSGHSKVYLIKTDSNGEMEWNKTYGNDDDGSEGNSVQQTSDGGYIIAGTCNCTLSAYLIKTNARGEIEWTKTYTGNYTNFCRAAKQTKDGGYILTGLAYYPDEVNHTYFVNDFYLLKTDSNGELLWNKFYGGYENLDYGFSVEQTSDDGYVLTGSVLSDYWQIYLIKTDSNGELGFNRTYGNTGNYDGGFSGNFVQQTSDGGYIIACTYFPTDRDIKLLYMIKTDSTGKAQWERTYPGKGQSDGYAVEQTNDGGYIITGLTQTDSGGEQDVYLIKIAPGSS